MHLVAGQNIEHELTGGLIELFISRKTRDMQSRFQRIETVEHLAKV